MKTTFEEITQTQVGAGTLAMSERLSRVIAAAAPFHERASGEYFVAAPERVARDVATKVSRWIRTVAPDDAAVRAFMEHRAAAGRDLGAGLRTVTLRDKDCLPTWAEALARFIAAQPVTAEADETKGASGAALAAFRRAARKMMPLSALTSLGVEITEDAHEDIIDQVESRLREACAGALQFEIDVACQPGVVVKCYETDDLDMSQEGWIARFESLPALAYVVGLAFQQWHESVSDVMTRLANDLPMLRRELWQWADIGRLSAYRGDAGDRHAGGKAVALLGFEYGHGVVYKPKELRHVVAFTDLVTFLNGHGLPLGLPTRRVIERGEYGWEERIVAKPTADVSEFPDFYRRLGMLIRLAQFLSGRDLFCDNLIAAGAMPVFIDLECMLYPQLDAPVAVNEHQHAVIATLDDSVVRTAMALQPWMDGTKTHIRDLGCLSHAGDAVDSDGKASLPLPPYRPWCGDVIADPWEYTDEVVSGYEDMHGSLVANSAALAAPGGPLDLYRGAWTRYLWRSTFECYNILKVSISPIALTDASARETILAAVLRGAFLVPSAHGVRQDIPEMAESELAAFRMMDVPLFATRTDSTSLLAWDGHEIPNHFEVSAWQRLTERVTTVADFDLDSHRAILTACLDAAAGGADRPRAEILPDAGSPDQRRASRRARPRTDQLPSPDQLLSVATDVATTLLHARATIGRGEGFVAATWYPFADLRQVEAAPADLFGGALSPALYLAEMFAATGDPRYWSIARAEFETAVAVATNPVTQNHDLAIHGEATAVGGMFGLGAIAYACARGGALLGDAETLTAALHFVRLLPARLKKSRRVYEDTLTGSAGLLCNLLRVRIENPNDEVEFETTLAELVGRAVVALGNPVPDVMPLPEHSRLRRCLPLGRDGVAMAVARAIELAPELLLDPAGARAALAAHDFDVASRSGRLAHLSAVKSGAVELRPDVLEALYALDVRAVSARELLAGAHEAALAHQISGDDRALACAAEAFNALVARRQATGSWFGDRQLDDRVNLSCLEGLPAVGLLALQLLFPVMPTLPIIA